MEVTLVGMALLDSHTNLEFSDQERLGEGSLPLLTKRGTLRPRGS